MWNDEKRRRFQELRQSDRQLTSAEMAELAAYEQELEAAEGAYLKPATERLRRENGVREKQNAALDELIKRKEALAKRLQATLADARVERRAIDDELATVLASGPASEMDD